MAYSWMYGWEYTSTSQTTHATLFGKCWRRQQMMMVMNEVFLVFVRIIKELTSDSLILNICVRAHQHESDHSGHTLSKMLSVATMFACEKANDDGDERSVPSVCEEQRNDDWWPTLECVGENTPAQVRPLTPNSL